MELTLELQEKKRLMIAGLKKTYKVQYDAVQPIPYIKDRLFCVDKVFVEGGVEVCLASELTRDTGGSWERLESYNNIYTDFRLNFKRRIIQGEPGYGKSTLTLQLAYDWCNGVWNSSMRNVEILILLRLRQLGGVQSIYRAIKLFLLANEHQVTVNDIKIIIQNCSSVNIILDGYDEYPNRDSNSNNDVDKMIVMELFQNVDVTVTTRYLPKCLIKETKRAKLTGFDEQARDEYIRKAVVGDNEEAVEQIKRRLYENSVLADICQVPLIFVMFAHIAHDLKRSIKLTSVTQFFKYMIGCFHAHLKRKFTDTRNNIFYIHETEHHKLDKIAFKGLNKQHQQLSWNNIVIQQKVGREFYDQYISIGILIEEQVVSEVSMEDNVLYTTEVRFYHKIFCEWYAAHHLVTLVKNAYDIEETLGFLDPFDLQYLFRFACGLDPNVGKKLINYLKRLQGGDTFAILCILEQTGDFDDIKDSVKELCSRDVNIKRGDSALLQRSTTQLLDIASNNNIPISCLHLEFSSIKFEGDTIILKSGISLPILLTVENIHIDGSNVQHDNTETLSGTSNGYKYRRHGEAQSANQERLTEKDMLNLFRYAMKSRRLKGMMLSQLQLPTSVLHEEFTDKMKTRNICVRWRPFDIDFHLDLQIGHWEVVDSQVLENIRDSTVSIDDKHSTLQQRSTVQLLHAAHRHNTPISCVYLNKCVQRFQEESFVLKSGIHLNPMKTVKHICIEKGMETIEMRKITEQDMNKISLYGMQSHELENISFRGCLLPLDNMSEYIPSEIKTRDITVTWLQFGYRLKLQTGEWEVADLDPIRALCTKTVSIRSGDSPVLQRCTTRLLENAAKHDIPITCLYLKNSFSYIDAGNIILKSGLQLSCPASVKKVVIDTEEGREMTEAEFVDILMFVQQSHMLEELEFKGCLLPPTFSSVSIPAEKQPRDFKVFWSKYDYCLDLQSVIWKVHVMDTVRKLCGENVIMNHKDSELLQRCTIQLLKNASNYNIPIYSLHLYKSYSKINARAVILHSGLQLTCPVSVKKVKIDTEYEREMTETEVVDIMMFVKQSHMLEELMFEWCMLPQSIPAESIPSILKSRNVKVSWGTDLYLSYTLNLQSGGWMRHGTKQEITDTEYSDVVTKFRRKLRDMEW